MLDNYENIFSLYETIVPTNEDIIVTILPPLDILRYDYVLEKDGEIILTNSITGNQASNVILEVTGIYSIKLTLFDNRNVSHVVYSGNYKIDKEKPIINLSNTLVNIKIGENYDYMAGVSVTDNYDETINNKITTNYNELNLHEKGLKQLVYTVTDEAGNTSSATLNINVLPDNTGKLLFFGSGILIVILLIFALVLKYLKGVKLEKRISKYTIEPIKDNYMSVFDKIFSYYRNFNSKIGKIFSKSVFLVKYSKQYEKYINTVDSTHKETIDFIVSKVFIGVIFLVIAIFSKTIQLKVLSIYEIIIPLTLGFFILDIVYFTKYKVYRNRIENDLLQAIIIMNNAFKSGRSIMQAIDLVASELEGPIAEEFKKMSLEISFGLSIENAFRRFSERIQLDEVRYLTASLSILNKTGGNIIKVFSSIEKTLFNQKKLKLELKALTGSSKIIVYVLFVVPLLFIIFISIIDPTYFLPMITTPLGFILTAIILVVYIIYIFVVRKVMKVRM